ncbi:CIA30 family protein [Marinicella sp. W31]|uniref:CIA30 family protein n=1 Tax=Marinicella sp. W31 TaxID=3023713 RepID=UPI003757498E
MLQTVYMIMMGLSLVGSDAHVSLMDDKPTALWSIVNDDVMGGISAGDLQSKRDHMLFSGELSLANNGGFASVAYTGFQQINSAATGVYLDVSGDARDFQLRLRMNGYVDGISYRAFFQPNEQRKRIYVEFSELQPVFRGRQVLNAPPLDIERVRQLGFLIGDKNTDPFQLKIHDFGFYYAGAD